MNIQELFNPLFACPIDKIDYDYRGARLSIYLVEPETKINHKIIFHGVITSLWTMSGFEGEICEDIFQELTSIHFIRTDIAAKDKWLKSFPLDFNISIEIMDRALLINANAVEIDSKLYYLKEHNNLRKI